MRPAVGQAAVSPSLLGPAAPGPRSSVNGALPPKALRFSSRPAPTCTTSKPAAPHLQTAASPPPSARPATTASAASAPPPTVPPSAATPPRPPKRPVRSRRLQPEALDPEDPAAYTNFFPPHPTFAWEWEAITSSPGVSKHSHTSHSGDPLHTDPAAGAHGSSAAGPALAKLLPACYHTIPAGPNGGQHGMWGQSESGSVYPQSSTSTGSPELEGLRRNGGFLRSSQQVAELLQPRQLPTARQLLGLSLDYAEHFFSGPDYRYAVDDQGRLVDMVAHIRTRVPARFDRARPSPGTMPPPYPSTSPQASFDLRLEAGGSNNTDASFSDDLESSTSTRVPEAPSAPDPSVADPDGDASVLTLRDSSGDSSSVLEMSVSDLAQEAHMAGAEPTVGVDGDDDFWAAGDEGQAIQAAAGSGEGSWRAGADTQAELQEQQAMPGLATSESAAEQGCVGAGARDRSSRYPHSSTTATPSAALDDGSLRGDASSQPQEASSVRVRSGGGYLRDPYMGAASSEDVYLDDGTPASAARRHSRSTRARGSLQAPLTPAEALAARRSLMARNVGVLPGSSVGDPGLARGQVKGGGAGRGRGPGIPTFRAVPIPPDLVLRVFPYCIGPSELFHGLWDLELLEQVRYVQRVEDADVVLHRRPQPGEKQFAYDTFRARAKSMGIPFSSLWNGSAAEIQRSLLPVFALYAGLATPEEVAFEAAPGSAGARGDKKGKKKRGARRIRL